MLLKKITTEEYVSELPIPKKELIPIASPIKDLSKAKIAVLTQEGEFFKLIILGQNSISICNKMGSL